MNFSSSFKFDLSAAYVKAGPTGNDSFIGEHDGPYNNQNADTQDGLTPDQIATLKKWDDDYNATLQAFDAPINAQIAALDAQLNALSPAYTTATNKVSADITAALGNDLAISRDEQQRINTSVFNNPVPSNPDVQTVLTYTVSDNRALVTADIASYASYKAQYADIENQITGVSAQYNNAPAKPPMPAIGNDLTPFEYSEITVNGNNWSFT